MAEQQIYHLPRPSFEPDECLNAILRKRRTNRAFALRPVSLSDVAQLLWGAQGISSDEGYRTAPSAGALYPLELHLAAGQVTGLPAGIYRYDPVRHELRTTIAGDIRQGIAEAALGQYWVGEAPAIIIVSAVDTRTTGKYGERGIRYVHIEVGHASQNLLLQAVALGLGGAMVGAFDDERLKHLLRVPVEERPLAIVPIGYPR